MTQTSKYGSSSSSIHSSIHAISIAPLQVHYYMYYSEALPTQHGYCAGISRWSATGNCELRTCPSQGPYVAAGAGVEPFGRKASTLPMRHHAHNGFVDYAYPPQPSFYGNNIGLLFIAP